MFMGINIQKVLSKIYGVKTIFSPKKSKMTGAVAAMVVIGLAATGGYFFSTHVASQRLAANPQKLVEDQNNKLIQEVEKVYLLPENEKPSVATVKDKEKLKSNPLFDTAENGDKILIYSKSRRFVVYRPEIGKVVDVIRLSTEQSGQVAGLSTDGSKRAVGSQDNSKTPTLVENPSPTPTPTPTENIRPSVSPTPSPTPTPTTLPNEAIKIALYNGTKTVGLTKKIEAGLKEKGYQITVTTRADAYGNYDKTQVIDLTGNNLEIVSKLASDLGGEVTKLPQNEKKPEAEVLIIGGSNL